MMHWEGIFAAYMTGSEGQGFAMFAFQDGNLVGADPLGVRFSGKFTEDENGSLDGIISVTIPPNGTVVQGFSSGQASLSYEVPLKLGKEATDGSFFQIGTPLGAVNVRLERLTGLVKSQ